MNGVGRGGSEGSETLEERSFGLGFKSKGNPVGDSKQRLIRFMFPKGHSGYREQDGSRGEGAKRESSEEPLDCGSEGGSVLRDAPPPPAPPHWLARGSQQLERSRQVTTLFSWERCRARPGWLGRWGLWEARTTRQRWGGRTPPPGQGLPARALRKGSGTTRPESGRREGLAARCVLLPFGKAAQGVE